MYHATDLKTRYSLFWRTVNPVSDVQPADFKMEGMKGQRVKKGIYSLFVNAKPSLDSHLRRGFMSLRSLQALCLVNFFMADVRDGLGPFLGIFLTEHHWQTDSIGWMVTLGGLAGLLATMPSGLLLPAVCSSPPRRCCYGYSRRSISSAFLSLLRACLRRLLPLCLPASRLG